MCEQSLLSLIVFGILLFPQIHLKLDYKPSPVQAPSRERYDLVLWHISVRVTSFVNLVGADTAKGLWLISWAMGLHSRLGVMPHFYLLHSFLIFQWSSKKLKGETHLLCLLWSTIVDVLRDLYLEGSPLERNNGWQGGIVADTSTKLLLYKAYMSCISINFWEENQGWKGLI